MTDIISDFQLTKECDALAQEIFETFKDENTDPSAPWDYDPEDYRDEMLERAHETTDGHQWVIYTHYALVICAHCNTDAGEEFVDEIGAPTPFTLSGAASMIVYGEMRARTETELDRLISEYEAPEEPETEDE